MKNTTAKKIINELQALGDDKRVQFNQKRGWEGPQFGITLGKLRAYAKKYKKDHEVALELNKSNNLDVLILSNLLMDPTKLKKDEMIQYIKEYPQLIDEYVNQVVSESEYLKPLSYEWIDASKENIRQAGWKGLVHLVENHELNEDEMEQLLLRISNELNLVEGALQFNMNHVLAQIGIESDKLRTKAKTIAQQCGVYRDMKVSKGCTSPYAIDWIDVILKKRVLTDSKNKL